MLTAVFIAVSASVFVNLLQGEGMIFQWYGALLSSWGYGGPKWRLWIAKPLGLCDLCLSGQLAFWWFIFRGPDYALDIHVFFVSFSIFITSLIKKTYE